jgi:hypothetical protein
VIVAAAAYVLLSSPLFQDTLWALEVEQVHWGFDGQVITGRFNLVSLLISNSSPQPFDGRLQLRKSVGARVVDAPFVETVYLAPHSSRWVQFYPYCKNDYEEWNLSWGPASQGSYDLTRPRQGKPACVLLEETGTLAAANVALKRFPDNLFPIQVTATDGLQSVVLDHVPRWEEARQRAFLEWLRHGGRVHLLYKQREEFPQFTGALQVLNSTLPRERVGSGMVFRHSRSRRELDAAYIENTIIAGLDPSEGAPAAAAAFPSAARGSNRSAGEEERELFSYEWEGDEPLLTSLKKMSRPEHSWLLIHLLSLVYIGLIFPGCFAIGRKRAGDYRSVFGALLAIVFVFSLAFLTVGRRGYEEKTTVHSIAVARLYGDGLYDVTQWSNAFVVGGGDYDFSHRGSGRMYSSCQDDEPVRGEIRSGQDARFTADMPPYSARTFGHRMVLDAAELLTSRRRTSARLPVPEQLPAELRTVPVTVVAWETEHSMRQETVTLRDMSVATLAARPERVLTQLRLVRQPHFPAEYRQVHVLFGRRVYSLSETTEGFELKSEIGSLVTFLRVDEQNQFTRFFDQWSELEGTPDELFEAIHPALVARACDVASHRDALKFALPDDRLRLLVYAPMPPAYFVQDDRFGAQRGHVLYCFEIFPPDAR